MALTSSVEQIIEKNFNGLLGVSPSWERVRLGDIADIQNGAPYNSAHFNSEGEGMPLLRIRDVGRDVTEAYYSGSYEESEIVQSGDLVIGMDGDFNRALWRGEPALLNQRVCRVVFRTDLVNRRFIYHVLPGYLAAVNAATPSVTVKHLSSKTVADLLLPLPPRDEQDRVVEAIDRLFSEVDEAAALVDTAAALSGAFESSVIEAVLSGVSSALPSHAAAALQEAEWSPLSAHAEIRYGWTAKAGDSGNAQMLRITDIQNGRVDWDAVPWCDVPAERLGEFRLTQGDIVFARTGATTGKSYLIGDDLPSQAVFASYLIRVRADDTLDPRFLALFFESAAYWRYIREQSRGIGQPNVNGKLLGALEIPVVARDVQKLAADAAEQAIAVVESSDEEVAFARRLAQPLRDAILRRAVTGRLVPQAEPGGAAELLQAIGAERATRAAPAADTKKRHATSEVG